MNTPSNSLAVITEDVHVARAAFLSFGVTSAVFEREAGFAIQALTAQKYTMEVAMMARQSVVNAVTNIAAMGLTLNPAKKQAYLVPRDGKICLDISYMGLLDIAIQSGSLKWGQAEVVYAADRFALNGFDKPPLHERGPFSKERGEMVGVYVVVKTLDGDYLTTTMTIDEVYGIRDRTDSWKSHKAKGTRTPWASDSGEMIKKTVIKRAYKLWPKTDRLENAIHHLNTEAGEGIDFDSSDPVDEPKNFGLTPERAKLIRKVACAALQKFNEDNEYGAYEEASGIVDNEEKQALWQVLRPHSALRSSLKRLAAEQRSRDDAMAAMQKPTASDESLIPLLEASIAQAKARNETHA